MLEPLPGRMRINPMQGGTWGGGGEGILKEQAPFHFPNNFSAPQNLLRA